MSKKCQHGQPAYCRICSYSKMIIWFKNGSSKTFYSFFNNDQKSRQKGIEALERIGFAKGFKGMWKSMIVYDNQTREQIRQWKDGVRTYNSVDN
jgi:hypothetical protein